MTTYSYESVRRRTLPVLQDRLVPMGLFLSDNTKTGYSINLPIAQTCAPTKACRDYCYATLGRIAMERSLGKQIDNWLLLKDLTLRDNARARALAQGLLGQAPRSADFVRWNGSGDLIEGSVAVINALTEIAPEITQWIITRKPRLAAKIVDHPAIRLLLSLDETTPPKTAKALRELPARFKKAAVRLSWVRTPDSGAIPDDVDVIFNFHQMQMRTDPKPRDARVCEATLPGSKHDDACESCRRCFKEKS